MKLFLSLLSILCTASFTIAVESAVVSLAELKEKSAQGLRLLRLSDGAEPIWKTEEEKLDLLRSGLQFFDITEVHDPDAPPRRGAKFLVQSHTYSSPSHQPKVNAVIRSLSVPNMQAYLNNLTSFNNRYYKSSTGAAATGWIVQTVGDIIRAYPNSMATVSAFKHSWGQDSIIARIPGSTDGPITILGAHMDSINMNDTMDGRAPGADDDGSGTVNLMEAFRALLEVNFRPATPVEFHWYSAEEVGLLGSQAIAQSYKKAGAQVKAMMQLDMTDYVKPGSNGTIGLMPDYTNQNLTSFVASVIETYTSLSWVTNYPCGYACSDHASWDQQGYPTALPYEAHLGEDHPHVHTDLDSTSFSGFSWQHAAEFAKIAIAFAYELGA